MLGLRNQTKSPHSIDTKKKIPLNLNKSDPPTTDLENRANNRKINEIHHKGAVIDLKVLGISFRDSATNEIATCINGDTAKTTSKMIIKYH